MRRGGAGRIGAAGRALVALIGVLSLLAACTVPPPRPLDIEATIDILAPERGFSPSRPPADLGGVGAVAERFDVGDPRRGSALRVRGGGAAALLVRPTRAPLIVSPYLSWTWTVEPHARDAPPVGIVVGFQGGRERDRDRPAGGSRDAPLPAHDRALVLTWGDSALQRGSVRTAAADLFDGRPAPRYIVRGGGEHTGVWWRDTVDLASLYGALWPQDDIGLARIVFVAIAAPADVAAGARLAGMTLSR